MPKIRTLSHSSLESTSQQSKMLHADWRKLVIHNTFFSLQGVIHSRKNALISHLGFNKCCDSCYVDKRHQLVRSQGTGAKWLSVHSVFLYFLFLCNTFLSSNSSSLHFLQAHIPFYHFPCMLIPCHASLPVSFCFLILIRHGNEPVSIHFHSGVVSVSIVLLVLVPLGETLTP